MFIYLFKLIESFPFTESITFAEYSNKVNLNDPFISGNIDISDDNETQTMSQTSSYHRLDEIPVKSEGMKRLPPSPPPPTIEQTIQMFDEMTV